MKINKRFLLDIKICEHGLQWFDAHPELEGIDHAIICEQLLRENQKAWYTWLQCAVGKHCMNPDELHNLAEEVKEENVLRAIYQNRFTRDGTRMYLDPYYKIVQSHLKNRKLENLVENEK